MRVYEVSAAAVRRPYVLAGANLAPGFIRQALLAMRARLIPLALDRKSTRLNSSHG